MSRDLEQVHNIVPLLEDKGIEVDAFSLIETKEVLFTLPIAHFDWVFFFSSNAVEFFFRQNPSLPEDVLFGAVGPATAASLKNYKRVTYSGFGNKTELVSEEFMNILGSKSVLVPQSDISIHPLLKKLGKDRCHDLICYRTALSPKIVQKADVYVFSSPSNVQSFFLMNSWDTNAKSVSFGPATTRALLEHGVRPFMELENMDSNEIVRAIMDVVCS
jgi:hydroxymethylbilane synthase